MGFWDVLSSVLAEIEHFVEVSLFQLITLALLQQIWLNNEAFTAFLSRILSFITLSLFHALNSLKQSLFSVPHKYQAVS